MLTILDANSFRKYVKAEHLELSKVKNVELFDFMKRTRPANIISYNYLIILFNTCLA